MGADMGMQILQSGRQCQTRRLNGAAGKDVLARDDTEPPVFVRFLGDQSGDFAAVVVHALGNGVGDDDDPSARHLAGQKTAAQQPVDGTVEAPGHIAVTGFLRIDPEIGVLGVDPGLLAPPQERVLRFASEERRPLGAATGHVHQPFRGLIVRLEVIVAERPVREVPFGEARRAAAPEQRAAADGRPGIVVQRRGYAFLVVFAIRPCRPVPHQIVDLRRDIAAAAERRRSDVAGKDEGTGLQDHHRKAVLGKLDGGGDAGRPRADHQRVDIRCRLGDGKGVCSKN